MLLLSAMNAPATASVIEDKPQVGLVGTMVQSVDQATNSAMVKYKSTFIKVNFNSNTVFRVGNQKSTLENFFANATGKNYYMNLADIKPNIVVDMIWDGVSFATYKKEAQNFSGIVKQQVRNVVRVEDKVYLITDKTKIYDENKLANKSHIQMGQYAVAQCNAGTVYPEATVIKVWKNKPKTVGDNIDENDKKVSGTASDTLKGGVGKVNTPKIKRAEGKIVKKGGKAAGAKGSGGKTSKGGGQ